MHQFPLLLKAAFLRVTHHKIAVWEDRNWTRCLARQFAPSMPQLLYSRLLKKVLSAQMKDYHNPFLNNFFFFSHESKFVKFPCVPRSPTNQMVNFHSELLPPINLSLVKHWTKNMIKILPGNCSGERRDFRSILHSGSLPSSTFFRPLSSKLLSQHSSHLRGKNWIT